MAMHTNTVFRNSCLRVPVDPGSRLPCAMYERRSTKERPRGSSPSKPIRSPKHEALSFGDFYRSIPDYSDLTHLSSEDFESKVRALKDDRRRLLSAQHGLQDDDTDLMLFQQENKLQHTNKQARNKERKSQYNNNIKQKQNLENFNTKKNEEIISDIDSILSSERMTKLERKYKQEPPEDSCDYLCLSPKKQKQQKRTGSSGSISWHGGGAGVPVCRSISAPSSPTKVTRTKPFLMTERDDDNRMLSQLRAYSRDLEAGLLSRSPSGHFRARAVPVESRVPLYDKLVEDQQLRSSICKLQSQAELQAKMRPFSFTLREEEQQKDAAGGTGASPELVARPQQQFKANPVPKNLFSNYVYDKMKEDDFYRSLSRRIRAEEMLRVSTLPPSMARREAGGGSPCRHQDRDRERDRELQALREELLHCSSSSSSRTNTTPATGRRPKSQHACRNKAGPRRVYSAPRSQVVASSCAPAPLLVSAAAGRSNLCAVLRQQATRRRQEQQLLELLEEQRFQEELRWRDSVLRRRPAWGALSLHSHSAELAARLETRRAEERLRRQEFLLHMESMYGRVHQQPLLFERAWGGRSKSSARKSSTQRKKSREVTEVSYTEDTKSTAEGTESVEEEQHTEEEEHGGH